MASFLLSSSSLHFRNLRPITSLANPSPNPFTKSKSKTLTLNPISIAAATAIAGAALLLPSLRLSALACAPPPPPPPTTSTAGAVSEDPERLLEDHISLHPDDTKSLRALLDLKIKSNDIPVAINIIERLVTLEPHDKALPLLRTTLLNCAGDSEAAKRELEEILAEDALPVEAYHGLVMVAYRSGDSEELEKVLDRIVDAVELCREAKRFDDVRDLRLLAGQVCVIQGRYEDALELYDELSQEDPMDFRPYLCKGIVYSVLREKDEAEKQFKKYRKLVPKDHQYVNFFDEGMFAMKEIGQKVDEDERIAAMKS